MIKIKIEQHEKDKLLATIAKIKDTVSVAQIGEAAAMNPNRIRFIIDELIDEGKLRKIPTKTFNAKFIRYRYEVIK